MASTMFSRLSNHFLISALLSFSMCSVAVAEPVLTPDGLGAVKLGMPLKQAEAAVGASFGAPGPGFGESCWTTGAVDKVPPGVTYMVENGVITRIDVWSNHAVPTTLTDKGIGVGASLAAARRAYGAQASERTGDYTEDTVIVVERQNPRRALRLDTAGEHVSSMSAGLYPSIDYMEGCL